jgi:hypothetical protein
MSFDFISLEFYTPLYFYILLALTFVLFFELNNFSYKASKWGWILVLFIIIYMGFRPISGTYFGDMGTYARQFEAYQNGETINNKKDVFFNTFISFCSKIMSVNFFFLTCAFLYVYPLYLVSKKWFKYYWFYAFLLLVASFSFWAYGTNGIRNGIGTSFFLLAVSRDKRIFQVGLILLAIGIHKSLILPAMGFLLAQFINKPKQMIAFWLLCIPLSLAAGGFWESLFASLGFDDRVSYLTEGNVNDDEFSSTGFRWDFLIYSATAVYAGWYFIVKKGFNDKIYFWLFNTYIFANAFWILVIRANFSNRFAYLSWCMMALVIIYPFLKKKMMQNQHKVLAKVIVLYFAFTFLMNVILAK